jgi:hypothetical protein
MTEAYLARRFVDAQFGTTITNPCASRFHRSTASDNGRAIIIRQKLQYSRGQNQIRIIDKFHQNVE